MKGTSKINPTARPMINRNAIIFDQLVQLVQHNKKVLFFATSVEHSKLISSLLKAKGYKSQHIDGNTGKSRSQIIKKFKSGEINVLCNYGVLSTGFDDPQIDVVFIPLFIFFDQNNPKTHP